jgi:hypothetical protein
MQDVWVTLGFNSTHARTGCQYFFQHEDKTMNDTSAMNDYAKALAAAHWVYVKKILKLHGESDDVIEKCGVHYTESMVHGFGHGVEWLLMQQAKKE